jgi:long-chain acyl-CoA synthetase
MYPTLNELFNKAVADHQDSIALRMLIPKERKRGRGLQLILNEISYSRLGEMAGRLATALNELGVEKGDRIALISVPRAAWATAFFAILRCGAIVVPLDPELQPGEIERILVEADVKAAIVSGLKVDDLQDIRANSLPDIHIISMDRPKSDDVLFLDQLLLGKSVLPEAEISSEDMAVLMYTSGTTGNAKGAMLLHRNIASNALSALKITDISETDNFLTIVPWYHIYGLTVSLLVPIFGGATTTYAPVDRNLTVVMRRARPTILLGVPKLYNVLYSKVMSSIQGSLLKRTIYKLSPRLMGKLVSKKLFGKDFRFFTSGGAPFNRQVANGFRRMGIGVMDGYGLSETAPILAMCERFATEPGMAAFEDVQLRIDEPDETGVGEVLARGPNIMAGYYKNPKATSEVIDE